MSGPFKMKGSPFQRNFGIGASPMKQEMQQQQGTMQQQQPQQQQQQASQKKQKPDAGPQPPKKTARDLWIENNPRKPFKPEI